MEGLQTIIDNGDKKASYKLDHLYLYPPYSLNKKPEDKKSLAIYEDLTKKNDLKAIQELVTYHLYYSCNKNPKRDQKTGFSYMKKLYKIRNSQMN
ncbi:hypothetical protein CRV02_14750 [Arcobacter sp. CECT 8989]|uniref:hypothetical protein n=1 Tax=Arcobacter sp. CECT 8989 TaxID=2044509 RepID=UPI00100A37C4|nr:hypothetical protein [Arcobacter sp. CECT 8989]RXJ93895.1 hypothetical protein CRV02_14750 [Arcobacter sp. CECT 8989]